VHRFRSGGLGIHLAIEDSDTGAHGGAISLFNVDWRRGCTEVGYGVRTGLRGRGYVTEALAALTSWALSEGGMARVELKTESGNAASRRVAEKVGYTREGTVADPASGEDLLLVQPVPIGAPLLTNPYRAAVNRSARKSSQVRWPTARSGARMAPARTARAAPPGSRTGMISRCW
jgi:Acetyltransferase (GNAT) domain